MCAPQVRFCEKGGGATRHPYSAVAPAGGLLFLLFGFRRPGCFPFFLRRFWHFGHTFAHGFPFQIDLVGVMNQAIQNRVRQRGIANDLMPVFHRQLAGDQGRTFAAAVLDQFQEIPPSFLAEGIQSPIVQ